MRTKHSRILPAANAIIRVHCKLPGCLSKAAHNQSFQASHPSYRTDALPFSLPSNHRLGLPTGSFGVLASFHILEKPVTEVHNGISFGKFQYWWKFGEGEYQMRELGFFFFFWSQFIAPLEDGHLWVNAHFILPNSGLNVMQRAKGGGSHYHNASDLQWARPLLPRECRLIKVSRFMFMPIAACWRTT